MRIEIASRSRGAKEYRMPMSETDPNALVHYSVENKVATITLNRPEKLNAFSDELVVALDRMLRRFDADPQAFTAIIHGAGRAFSTGADVHQRQLRKREEFELLKVMARTPP